jgi:hypothetical protein
VFVVCHVNSYKERECRIMAMKFNIVNVLHQSREVEFSDWEKNLFAGVLAWQSCTGHYFAQYMHLVVCCSGYICCYFVSSQHPVLWLGNTLCCTDLTEGETTAWCGLNDSFSLIKVVCVRARVRIWVFHLECHALCSTTWCSNISFGPFKLHG